MTDSHDINNLLAAAQQLYDGGHYDTARTAADRILATLEREQRDESIEYSEAMRIFGMASYRAGDIVMADNALTFAYNIRCKAGLGDDAVTRDILLALSEAAILRDNPVRASRLLERLREISK